MTPADWSNLSASERSRLIAKQSKGFGPADHRPVHESKPRFADPSKEPTPPASERPPEPIPATHRRFRGRRRLAGRPAATPILPFAQSESDWPTSFATLAFDCDGYLLVTRHGRYQRDFDFACDDADARVLLAGLLFARGLRVTDLEIVGDDPVPFDDRLEGLVNRFRSVEYSWHPIA